MEEYIDEQTTCSVCLDILKDPNILSCLHTFCHDCINNVMRKNRIACPLCKTESTAKDMKNDFKIKKLIEIRLKQDHSRPTAKQQIEGHLENLDFLKKRYKRRLEQITSANRAMEEERLGQLRAYKRKWIDAIEKECELAEINTRDSAQTDDTQKKVKKRITEIDSATNEVEAMLGKASGAATAHQTHSFSGQIVNLSENFPPLAATVKLPVMAFLDHPYSKIRDRAHSCFNTWLY